jgi:hypothetical protein
MALGFFEAGDDPLSYEGMQRKRRLAEALMQQGMSNAPIQSWTEGAARIVSALAGNYQANQLDKKDAESTKLLAQVLTGGSGASSSPAPSMGGVPAPKPSPSTAMTTGDATGGDMGRFRDAIASIESKGSGDYAAVGPTHPKLGRALGRYQVMEANIGPWSEAALGRRVSAEEFLKNPQLQDAIFDHRFGEYVKKYGNPQDAASAWFTGRPLAQGANARDSLGTSGSQYVQKFAAALGGGAPVQVASAGGATAYAPNAIAQALTPQAQAPAPQVAPAQQMAQAPMPQPQGQGQGDMAQRLQAVLMDPRFSPQQKQMALQMFQLQQKDEGVSPVDLGDRIALMNKRGQVMGYLPKQQQPKGPMVVPEGGQLYDPASQKFIGSGPPKMTDPQRNYQFYSQQEREAGREPKSFNDWQNEGRRAGAMRSEGTIPPGYRAVRDPQGNIISLEPIPGSAQARAETAKEATAKADANRVIATIDQIDKEMKSASLPTTGFLGSKLSAVGGTAANNIARMIETIEANVSFGKLNEMRSQSPTGGALGSVTERELALLGASVANLKQSQTEEQFRRNLQMVKNAYLDIVHGPGTRPEAPQSGEGGWQEIDGVKIRRVQ